MFDYIMIHTIDRNINRYDKKYIENYEVFKNSEELKELLKSTLLLIETNTRK